MACKHTKQGSDYKCPECENETTGNKSASVTGLEGPLSYEYKPDGFEKFVLDYTASTKWEQIRDLDWTTAEMLDLVKTYLKNKAD